MEVQVIIVGAGPSGISTSVCLSQLSIPNMILEKEDCAASLWKKRAYDRLHLHLAKSYCELPFMPYPPKTENFMSKDTFIQYVDSYVSHFNINPRYNRDVVSASLDENVKKWRLEARNVVSGEVEVYLSNFLVVATGENNGAFMPNVPGLDSFSREIVHSSEYKCGSKYKDKDVLVIGCGNSGMEISYDLANYGARTSIVVRSPFHVMSKEMVYTGMQLLQYFPLQVVDALLTLLSKMKYGDLSRYGVCRPSNGPFYHKILTGKSPIINVGTVEKIQAGEIKVFPGITNVTGNTVVFEDGSEKKFDAIICATGYTSMANKWLKESRYILNEKGMPKDSFPNHWKGENGVYCVGFSKMGLHGISSDAKFIAQDINQVIGHEVNKGRLLPGIILEVPSLVNV